MPSADHILNSLQVIANAWKIVSIFWHIFFGMFILILAMGIRPSRQVAASLLSLPLLSVSSFAWLSSNPFNGAFFAAIGISFLLMGIRLSRESVKIAPLWSFIPGLLLFGFGWFYPHFLNTLSYLPYVYAAPIGLIPCPTLIIVIGFVLMLDNLGSEKLNLMLGVSGLLYGILGVAYLHMTLDWVLILAASIILSYFLLKKRRSTSRRINTTV